MLVMIVYNFYYNNYIIIIHVIHSTFHTVQCLVRYHTFLLKLTATGLHDIFMHEVQKGYVEFSFCSHRGEESGVNDVQTHWEKN